MCARSVLLAVVGVEKSRFTAKIFIDYLFGLQFCGWNRNSAGIADQTECFVRGISCIQTCLEYLQ